MTVAALILHSTVERALADTAGRPAVRRMVEAAWAGGATPIVVVAPDAGDRVAQALAGSPTVLAEPPPAGGDAVERAAAQVERGFDVARQRVTDTDAALVWPGRMVWVDAETITSLIEAHGADREVLLRPTYGGRAGWPALMPATLLPALANWSSSRSLEELIDGLAGDRLRLVETGDPGTVHDSSTPIDQLPAFEGPPEPVAGPPPEWGSAAAEDPDEGPLTGPALAPYGQAAADSD